MQLISAIEVASGESGRGMRWGGFRCICTILLLEREKVLSKCGRILTCVKSGGGYPDVTYSLKYVMMKRFPFGILFGIIFN